MFRRATSSPAHVLPVCLQRHELTGDQREREAGSRVRPAGQLQPGQRPLPGPAGADPQACCRLARRRLPATMAAGRHLLSSQLLSQPSDLCSDLHALLSCGRKSGRKRRTSRTSCPLWRTSSWGRCRLRPASSTLLTPGPSRWSSGSRVAEPL